MTTTLNVAKEVAALEQMTVDELRRKFAEVFGEATSGRHKQWLVKRIAWRMQANAEGGLSERARRRALELANDADLRQTAPRGYEAPIAAAQAAPRPASRGDARLPTPGTILTRDYKGRTLRVTVRKHGFEFEGELYKSLTAVAKAATGAHWNGYLFFGLRKEQNPR